MKARHERLIKIEHRTYKSPDGTTIWIWGESNEVIKIIESEVDFSISDETGFNDSGLQMALKKSRLYTPASSGYFFKDKILRCFSPADWINNDFQEIIIPQHHMYKKSNQIYVSTPMVVREISSLSQAEILGLSSEFVNIIYDTMKDTWPTSALIKQRPDANNKQGRDEYRRQIRIALSGNAGSTPNATASLTTVLTFRRPKVPWTALVEYPWSFDLMLYHANELNLPIDIGMATSVLLVASKLFRGDIEMISPSYHIFSPFENPFRSWVLGCAVAGRIAYHYSQTRIEKYFGRTIASSIAEIIFKIRMINLQIIKHIIRTRDVHSWNDYCDSDNRRVFNDADSKWQKHLLVNVDSTRTRMLTSFLNMFKNIAFQFDIKLLQDLLKHDILPSKNFKRRHSVQEENILGRQNIVDSRRLAMSQIKTF